MQVASVSTPHPRLRSEIDGWTFEDASLLVRRSDASNPGKIFIGYTPSPKDIPNRGDWGFRVTSDPGLYEVTTITVSQILRNYPSNSYALAIVKIDIEGGEQDLFSGEVGWLEAVPLVIIELHDWMFPGEASARNFLRAISTFDFDFVYCGENVFCFNNTLLGSR